MRFIHCPEFIVNLDRISGVCEASRMDYATAIHTIDGHEYLTKMSLADIGASIVRITGNVMGEK